MRGDPGWWVVSGGDSEDLWAEFDRLGSDPPAEPAAAPAPPPSRTVLMLPGLRADAVARICTLLGLSGYLVPQPGSLLLVSDQPIGTEAIQPFSAALRKVQVLRIDLKDSYLRIEVWQQGTVTGTPNAGVLAQQLPDPVLGLVHGSTDPATLPDARPISDPGGGGGFFSRLRGR